MRMTGVALLTGLILVGDVAQSAELKGLAKSLMATRSLSARRCFVWRILTRLRPTKSVLMRG